MEIDLLTSPVIIPLTHGAYTIVDREDYERLGNHRWYVTNYGYAIRLVWGTKTHLLLHREIMNAPKGKFLDHIDCNKLNNKKENLRYATYGENSRNRRKYRSNTSGYKGISWDKQMNKWSVSITVDKKRVYRKLFKDKETAIRMRNIMTMKIHGDFAKLD